MFQYRTAAAFGRVGRKDRLDQHLSQQPPNFPGTDALGFEFAQGRPDALAPGTVARQHFALFERPQPTAFFGQVHQVKVGRKGPYQLERAIQVEPSATRQ